MQFIIVEWEVYSLTKDPLSLGLIGLVEVIPAISTALFAGHIVDQREKKMLFVQCITAFLLVAIGYYFITSPYAYENYENSEILIGIYILVFIGGFVRAFIGPTIFSLVALIVPKRVYPNAATWSSSTWQLAVVLGPAFAGFSIAWIGVHNSMGIVLGAWLGPMRMALTLFGASLLSLLVWIGVSLVRGFDKDRAIPLGPFLSVAGMGSYIGLSLIHI